MALDKRPLLTIAIPTYNRSSLLRRNLESIQKSMSGFENIVEVVISDNNSDDDTATVIKDFDKYQYIKYYRNIENIGFNHNYIKLIDIYANGEYCWVIGDDDFIRIGAITILVSILLKNRSISFISLSYDINWSLMNITDCPSDIKKVKIVYFDTFKDLISRISIDGNILMEFISASIFKTEKVKALKKNFVSSNSLDLPYFNMFPHSCYFALVFKDEKSLFIDEKMFYANLHDIKGWEENVSNIYFLIQPYMLNYFLTCGFSNLDLKKQKKLMIKSAIPFLMNKNISVSHFRNKITFINTYIFDFDFYRVALILIIKKIKNFSK